MQLFFCIFGESKAGAQSRSIFWRIRMTWMTTDYLMINADEKCIDNPIFP